MCIRDSGGTAAHLTHDGVKAGPGGDGGAAVRRAERDQGAHPAVPAQPLHVVPGDQPAEAVPDDVHPVVPGARADGLHLAAEQGGGGPDVAGQRRVVERGSPAVAVPGQGAAQDEEHGAVVDEAVQQDDGGCGGGGGGVARDREGEGTGGGVLGAVCAGGTLRAFTARTARTACAALGVFGTLGALGGEAEGIGDQVSGEDGQFQCGGADQSGREPGARKAGETRR